MNFLIGSNDTESGLTDVVIIKFIYFIQEWRVRKNESFKIFNIYIFFSSKSAIYVGSSFIYLKTIPSNYEALL